jgi:hypothetical protein
MWKMAGRKKLLWVLSGFVLLSLIGIHYIPAFLDHSWSLSDLDSKNTPARGDSLLLLVGWDFENGNRNEGRSEAIGFYDGDEFRLSGIWNGGAAHEEDAYSELDTSLPGFSEFGGRILDETSNPVPAPATILLFVSGLLCFAAFRIKLPRF